MARLTESAEVREEIVRALRLDLIGPWVSGPQRMFRAGRNQKEVPISRNNGRVDATAVRLAAHDDRSGSRGA